MFHRSGTNIRNMGPWFLNAGYRNTQDEAPDRFLSSVSQFGWRWHRDDGAELSFTVPIGSDDELYLKELETDIWIRMQDGPATTDRGTSFLERLRITRVDRNWESEGGGVATVTAVSYQRLLDSRYLHSQLVLTSQFQSAIVKALVDHTQAQPGGTLNILTGNTGNIGPMRDRTYEAGSNIGELLRDLRGVIGGPDWRIEIQKGKGAMWLRAPLRNDTIYPVPVELGGNALAMARQSGAEQFGNSLYGTGDNEMTTPVWYDSIGASSPVTDRRGRWERTASFPTVQKQTTLQENAQGALDELDNESGSWTIQIDPQRFWTDSDYRPGDRVAVYPPPAIAYEREVIAPPPPATAKIIRVVEVRVDVVDGVALGVTITGPEEATVTTLFEATSQLQVEQPAVLQEA